MALTLTLDDLVRLEAASRVLLSPLAAPDPAAWRREAIRAMCGLFGADAGLFFLPGGADVIVAEGFDDAGLARWRHYAERAVEAVPESPDAAVAAFTRNRRARQAEVIDTAVVHALVGGRAAWERSSFYNEVERALGLHTPHGLQVLRPDGTDATCVVYLAGADAAPFGDAGAAVLRTVLPAYRAGLDALGRLHAQRAAFDAVDGAVAVFDAAGAERYRNAALGALLAADPERDRLAAEVGRLGRALRPLAFPLRGTTAAPALAERTVRTDRGAYVLRGALLPPGAFGETDALLVTVGPVGPAPLPSAEAVRARLGLTRREAEVALLVAEGLPNDAIAERLFVSPHTARHHTENLMAKLGLNRRFDVAKRLRGEG